MSFETELFYFDTRAAFEFHYNITDIENSVKIIIFITSKLYITIHIIRFLLCFSVRLSFVFSRIMVHCSRHLFLLMQYNIFLTKNEEVKLN